MGAEGSTWESQQGMREERLLHNSSVLHHCGLSHGRRQEKQDSFGAEEEEERQ